MTNLSEKGEGRIVNNEEISDEEKEFEKKLLRKQDLRIMPLLISLFLLSYLDRANIGNAKLGSIEKDLGLVGNQFNWTLSIFFIGYILFDVPSNLVLIKTSPSIWIPTIVLGWGIVMTAMAFVTNYQGLLATRFLLGIFESGLYPAIIYYLTLWYKRSELNYRLGLFTVGVTGAGSFSGLLAFVIMRLDGKAKLAGWQWLFMLEGILTVLVALIAYVYISDKPETAKWINEKEREFIVERLRKDIGKAQIKSTDINKKQIYATLKDWKIYTSTLIILGIAVPVYSLAFFLPTIVNGLGFDFVISQLLSVPPFILGSISTLFVAITSDRKRIRGPFIITFSAIAIVGYILLCIRSLGIAVKYFGACVVGIGIFPCLATSLAWLTNNISGTAKKGISSALVISAANLGGVLATQIYRPKDRPHYLFGHLISIGSIGLTIGVSIFQIILLKNINKRKRENPESFLKGKEGEELGDKHPDFIYSL